MRLPLQSKAEALDARGKDSNSDTYADLRPRTKVTETHSLDVVEGSPAL